MIKQETWMQVAETIAKESKAINAKVGAVAIKDDRIIATGYNGTPPGYTNKCEDEDGKTKEYVIHAEINTIAFASKHGVALDGATMYCSLSPCVACAAVMRSAGIHHVVYRTAYRDTRGLQLLSDMGIKVTQLQPKE